MSRPHPFFRSIARAARAKLLLLPLVFLIFGGGAGKIAAQTRTWDGGGGNSSWNNATNWDGNTALQNGSALIFTGVLRTTNNNNLVNSVAGITFDNTTTSGAFTLGGNQVTLTGNITTLGSTGTPTHTISLDMILNGNRSITTVTNNNLTITGAISETGGSRGLTKEGGGTLTLGGNTISTFTGSVIVNQGTIKIGKISALGAANTSFGKVTVNSGGAVDFNGQIDAQYGYTIAGTGVGGTGALTNTGAAIGNGYLQASNIRLSADASIGGSGNWALLAPGYAPTNLDLAGHTLTKTGTNTIAITNTTLTAGKIHIAQGVLSQNNNFKPSGHDAGLVAFSLANTSGATLLLNNLNLAVGSLAGGGAAGGNVTLGLGRLTVGALSTTTDFGGSITGSGGITKLGSGTQTLSGANTYTGMTTISGGTLQLGNGGTGGSLATASAITVGAGATFAVNQSDTVTQGTDFSSAAITGAGGFSQRGSGTTILNAANSYTGATTVSAGTLLINGNQAAATGNVTVASGATLGGSGSVGGNTSINGGTHAPGSNAPGVLTHLGNLSYGANSTVQWELTSHTSGNGPSPFFDQIVVNGNLNFSGATTMNLNFNSAGSTVDWSDPFWDMVTVKDWLVYDVSGTTTGFGNLSLNGPGSWVDGVGGESFSSELGNNLPANANFYLYQSGNNIYLRYEAIPEPAGFALLALAMGLVTMLARPRRRLVVV